MLFREQVLARRKNTLLGEVSLAVPISSFRLGLVFVLAAGAAIAFLIFASYAKRTRVQGRLVPDTGVVTVTTSRAGVIGQVLVQEGASVRSGQVLAVIRSGESAQLHGDSAQSLEKLLRTHEAAIRTELSARANDLQAQRRARDSEITSLQAEMSRIDSEIEIRRRQIIASKQLEDRYAALAKLGHVSSLQVQQQTHAHLEQLAQFQDLKRARITTLRGIEAERAKQSQLPDQLRILQAQSSERLADLGRQATEVALSGALMLKAPLAGVISSVSLTPGQSVQPGQAIMAIVPTGSVLQAQLWVPSQAIGLMRDGDAVWLRFDAFPFQQFGQYPGRIVRISQTPMRPDSDAAQASAPSAEAKALLFRVVVALEKSQVRAFGKHFALKPGLTLEADVIGVRQPLWRWLYAPIAAPI